MASTSSSSRINNSRHAVRSSASTAFTQRLLIGLLVCTLVLDLSCLTEARPQDDPTSVAEAIRLLQELETKHAQHARPRFGKRGYLQPANYGQDEQERNYYRMIGRIQRFQDEQNAVLN
uniref:Neuropeptide F n=1 Tax=Culex pipiens TaxID=7175 RepID=A0A8D8FH70_CULPI